MDEKSRLFILKIHNKIRSEVARGERPLEKKRFLPKAEITVLDYLDSEKHRSHEEYAEDPQNEVEDYPEDLFVDNATSTKRWPASDMRALSYSKELEFVAQCWANTCPEDPRHDNCRSIKNHKNVGQVTYLKHNLHSNYTNENYLYEAFEALNSTLYLITSKRVENYEDSDEYSNIAQIVWASTYLVGCGRARFGKGTKLKMLIICNYAPSGNFEHKKIYTVGDSASACPYGTSSNKKYPRLCGDVFVNDTWDAPFHMGESIGLKLGVVIGYKYIFMWCMLKEYF